GIPGALSNQPPATGQAPVVATAAGQAAGAGAPSSHSRSQATRNYVLDRTVSYTKREKGRLRRLTVAVVIDDKKVVDSASGEATREKWTQAEIDRLSILIRDAVGYSAVRGDSVNILNEPFIPLPEFAPEVELPI